MKEASKKDKLQIEMLMGKGVRVFSKDIDVNILCEKSIKEYEQYVTYYSLGENKETDSDYYELFDDLCVAFTETGDTSIETINCDHTCTLKGKELIGMPYEEFRSTFQLEPEEIEKNVYSVGGPKNWRYYTIYYFHGLGFDLWVWRNRIRDLYIYDPKSRM